ncbi:adventurous gliding motility protein CglF [Vulgatibacter incomptus]|uniref:Uncharacterized protein n=1 Tax=Vulgatibacter incomptus TaxID=1391653 RepID=A0A0K1PCP7_9BACT|nr:adventurous gliding motility protein CglF [Vulgatibacter incomptus]AKU91308.1 hypothetical protein AKJ08_1695 [Vulgatibacter incomptus]
MKRMGGLIAGLLLLSPLAASAEDRVEYEKHTEINFEDDTIQGDLTRPDGELVDAKGKVTHSNLVKVRDTFRDQVLESVGEL